MPELWYRLGSAQEQGILQTMKPQHQGIVVPAHVFAFGRTWVSHFLGRVKKPFAIDPMTYVLALPREQITGDSGLKKSWDSLLGLYDEDALKPLRRRPLRPADMLVANALPSELLKAFVSRTVELQTTTLVRGSRSQQSLEKYRRILGEKAAEVGLRPSAVLAPYFHFEDMNDPWWKVNVLLVKEAKTLATGVPLYAVILTSVKSLEAIDWDVALSSLGPVDGYVLWITNYLESSADVNELTAVMRTVRRLSLDAPVFILYGGYFALSLAAVGLAGLISGICYGEAKALMSRTTGGGMPQRYYVAQNKTKYVMTEVRTLYSDAPDRLCGCHVCLEIRRESGPDRGRPSVSTVARFFDRMDDASSKRHFLEVRSGEARAISRMRPSEVVAALVKLRGEAEAARLPAHGMAIDHLGRWGAALDME